MVLASAEGVLSLHAGLYIVCHGVCMLVCEDWHWQRVCHGVPSACWTVKIGECVTVYSGL